MPVRPVHARFWEKVDRRRPGDCWLWLGGKESCGYGVFWLNRRQEKAHRVSLRMSGVDVPTEMFVLHSCDVRACVNPAHLRVGTHAENMRDRDDRGRNAHPIGERHPAAKLTEDDVRTILLLRRTTGMTQEQIASQFGVQKMIVSLIETGKRWKHITNPNKEQNHAAS